MAGPLDGGERPIEHAPEWVRALQSPPEELTAMRRQVHRYLAGDTSIPIAGWADLDGMLDDHDAEAAMGPDAAQSEHLGE
jgi:hypothetical protein